MQVIQVREGYLPNIHQIFHTSQFSMVERALVSIAFLLSSYIKPKIVFVYDLISH